ncbi:hypothetical protein [Alteromonas oceanisediminis]|uniref:hypothetical protein n=1 Tax=Alteromonas oceanisediminis TaxID=2836180 RepID=UPI001BD974C6|nr:hypothetical protein [Alteromonas oceanisediminis]MBT0584861.1 hypothetical protein [Alteromonas oceanisediminis]
MKYIFLVVGLLALAGCNSTDTASSSSSSEQNVAAIDKDDGVICKMERRTGSNMMTRVCRTAEERAAQEEAGREGLRRLQRGGVTSGADGE